MNKARIAVLVSGGGTNLQALIDSQKAGALTAGEIILVISNNKDAFALQRAKDNNIEAEVLLRKDFPSKEDYEKALVCTLKDHEIDLMPIFHRGIQGQDNQHTPVPDTVFLRQGFLRTQGP